MSMLSRLKQALPGNARPANFGRVPVNPVEHPILGALTPDKTHPHTLVGQVAYGEGFIAVQISPDNKSMDAALSLMADAVSSLADLDEKCRRLIATDSLEGYNTRWRFGQRALTNGAFENFEKPLLSEKEFRANLQFQSVEATGDSLLTLWYGDNDMFWGHGLYVDSFDGVQFKDTHVSMFG